MASMDERHQIAVLIDSSTEVNQMSLQQMADRATKAGYPISRQNLSRMRREPVRSVSPDQVRMLAAATGASEAMTLNAFLGAMGLPVGEITASTEDAIRLDPTLADDDKRTLLNLLEALRRPTPPGRLGALKRTVLIEYDYTRKGDGDDTDDVDDQPNKRRGVKGHGRPERDSETT